MKKTALFLVILAAFFACRKDADEVMLPEIAGVYQITTLHNMQGETLSFPVLTPDGKVDITSALDITKMDEYQISILRKGTAGGTPYTDPLGLFDIRKGEGEYIVYQDGLYIGSINGSKLYLNFAGKSRNTMISSIRASR
ncbi:hypothetical protein [Dyadobacter sandarakinus]|uniref:Lipocalin-like domain-containing protein n=1 Tax=Dyadobacter sandarakinus TaxID=2747268 RepID=A0ABX7I5K8_9BACT|nr:hypothetical protein [Dyadobacter sandarakinus]QRR01384.1 hypothetical protein HWI92_10960 [Dyadobacter sandarakinus]